jgi:hypothetical protein
MKLKFNQQLFPDIINCEGAILKVVELEDGGTERLYVRGLLSDGSNIYAKVNDTALEFFFQGRISIKELFLLRNDEKYILQTKNEYVEKHLFERDLEKIIHSIHCGDHHFHTFHRDSVIENPFENILKVVRRDYFNGITTLKSDD